MGRRDARGGAPRAPLAGRLAGARSLRLRGDDERRAADRGGAGGRAARGRAAPGTRPRRPASGATPRRARGRPTSRRRRRGASGTPRCASETAPGGRAVEPPSDAGDREDVEAGARRAAPVSSPRHSRGGRGARALAGRAPTRARGARRAAAERSGCGTVTTRTPPGFDDARDLRDGRPVVLDVLQHLHAERAVERRGVERNPRQVAADGGEQAALDELRVQARRARRGSPASRRRRARVVRASRSRPRSSRCRSRGRRARPACARARRVRRRPGSGARGRAPGRSPAAPLTHVPAVLGANRLVQALVGLDELGGAERALADGAAARGQLPPPLGIGGERRGAPRARPRLRGDEDDVLVREEPLVAGLARDDARDPGDEGFLERERESLSDRGDHEDVGRSEHARESSGAMNGTSRTPAGTPSHAVGHRDQLVRRVRRAEEDVEPLPRDVAADEERHDRAVGSRPSSRRTRRGRPRKRRRQDADGQHVDVPQPPRAPRPLRDAAGCTRRRRPRRVPPGRACG